MGVSTDKTISVLQNLIAICRDGEEGYRLAAEHETVPELQYLYAHYAGQRSRMASELEYEMLRAGGALDKIGSMDGTFRKAWVNIQTVVAEGGTQAVLEECERGEDIALKGYEEAVQSSLNTDARRLIERQFRDVQEFREKVSDLKARYEDAGDAQESRLGRDMMGAPD